MNFLFDKQQFNVETIVKWIHQNGFAVLTPFLDAHALSAFALSYEQVFNLTEPLVHIVTLDNGYLYNVQQRILKRMPEFDAFIEVFRKQELVDIAMQYMNSSFDYSPDSVNEVFKVEYNFRSGSTGGSPLHFDRVPALNNDSLPG